MEALDHYAVRRVRDLASARWEWVPVRRVSPDTTSTVEGPLHLSRSRRGALRGVIRDARSKGLARITLKLDTGLKP